MLLPMENGQRMEFMHHCMNEAETVNILRGAFLLFLVASDHHDENDSANDKNE